MADFSEKTVLITGAAGGIGRSLCESFASKGARIAALDRDERVTEFVDDLKKQGHQAAGQIADLRDAAAVGAAVEALREKLGPVSVLINNAGYSGASLLRDTDEEIWAADIEGNLNGAWHCTRAVMEDLKAADGGAIVTIGSVNGLQALGDPAYSAAKAGLISMTKSIALEYGRFGVRANIICPGTVRTPIWDHRTARDPTIFEQLVRWYPLQRVADPIDIAEAAMFLASSKAGAISGVTLPVDCGLSAGNLVMTRDLTLMDV